LLHHGSNYPKQGVLHMEPGELQRSS